MKSFNKHFNLMWRLMFYFSSNVLSVFHTLALERSNKSMAKFIKQKMDNVLKFTDSSLFIPPFARQDHLIASQ